MNEKMAILFAFIESSGVLAPVAYILFHIFRQFLFIPVAIVCMAGGLLFGAMLGTIYSIIGLTLSSIVFYYLFQKMPSTFSKILKMKEKWLGKKVHFTIGQIAILKLLPFIHFHLLSLCLVELSSSFHKYLKSSIYTNLPIALFYTLFGQFMRDFTPTMIIVLFLSLSVLFYLLREKQVIIKWSEFFR